MALRFISPLENYDSPEDYLSNSYKPHSLTFGHPQINGSSTTFTDIDRPVTYTIDGKNYTREQVEQLNRHPITTPAPSLIHASPKPIKVEKEKEREDEKPDFFEDAFITTPKKKKENSNARMLRENKEKAEKEAAKKAILERRKKRLEGKEKIPH